MLFAGFLKRMDSQATTKPFAEIRHLVTQKFQKRRFGDIAAPTRCHFMCHPYPINHSFF